MIVIRELVVVVEQDVEYSQSLVNINLAKAKRESKRKIEYIVFLKIIYIFQLISKVIIAFYA